MAYRMSLDGTLICRIDDVAGVEVEWIPMDELNADFQIYQQWLAEGNVLTPFPEKTLAERRAEAWERIKLHRDRLAEAGGCKVTIEGVDKWFHSDLSSQIKQIGLLLAGPNIAPGLMWKTMDKSFVEMTPALATQVYQSAMTQGATIFAVAEQHRIAMEASEDPDAYDFSAGWPPTFGG